MDEFMEATNELLGHTREVAHGWLAAGLGLKATSPAFMGIKIKKKTNLPQI